jgi:hypothetical protein
VERIFPSPALASRARCKCSDAGNRRERAAGSPAQHLVRTHISRSCISPHLPPKLFCNCPFPVTRERIAESLDSRDPVPSVASLHASTLPSWRRVAGSGQRTCKPLVSQVTAEEWPQRSKKITRKPRQQTLYFLFLPCPLPFCFSRWNVCRRRRRSA